MPGFKVGDLGINGAPGQPRTYYTYTWEIPNIFHSSGLRAPVIYCRDATLPTITIGQERVKGASLVYKYANEVNWEDVRITWYDTVGMFRRLLEWRKQVWTVEEGLLPSDSYKQRTILRSLLPDDTEFNEWTLENSWPSSIRYGDLTYTQSDVKIVEVIVTYDWAVESPS